MRVAHDQEQANAWMAQLQPLLSAFDYAAIRLEGDDRPVVQVQVAHTSPLEEASLAAIDTVLACSQEQATQAFADARRGVTKQVRIEDDRLTGVRFIGEIAAIDWLRDAMVAGEPLAQSRNWIFAPLARLPAALGGASIGGRTICSCHGVKQREIDDELESGADLARLQAKLKCGTECGSCLPELRRLVASHAKGDILTGTAGGGLRV